MTPHVFFIPLLSPAPRLLAMVRSSLHIISPSAGSQLITLPCEMNVRLSLRLQPVCLDLFFVFFSRSRPILRFSLRYRSGVIVINPMTRIRMLFQDLFRFFCIGVGVCPWPKCRAGEILENSSIHRTDGI